MISVDESKKIANEAKKEVYKKIGITIRMAPILVGMSEYRFHKEFAPYWGQPDTSPETVKNGLERGVPRRLKCDEVINGIEQAYQSYVTSSKLTPEIKALTAQLHDAAYPKLFERIKKLYKLIDIINDDQKWIKATAPLCSQEMVSAFMSGRISKSGEGLTAKEAEWLRAALVRFLPEYINNSK